MLVALLVPALAVLISCKENAKPVKKSGFVLVASGDTQGWITPCGCTSNQSGGMPRRGAYFSNVKDPVVYVDVGGAIDGETSYHAVKLAAILRGEVAMNVAAHNLGASELALGQSVLKSLAESTKAPFLCTNAQAEDGTPMAATWRMVTAGEMRVGLIGVISPKYQSGKVRIRAPREAILQEMRAHEKQYDKLIVLAYVPEDELEALARELPEVDAVIGGPTGQSIPAHKVGPTLVASATRKGKFLAEVSFLTGRESGVVELNEKFADAPKQMEILSAYLADLGKKDFEAKTTGVAKMSRTAGGTVAGSATCKSCHEPEYAAWKKSYHANGWESLEKKGRHVDPACQVCHTTGYALPGGFESISKSPERLGIGCENCHGPSLAHNKDPKTRTPWLPASQCMTCHDEENSPLFNYNAYWLKIQHGKPKTTQPGAAVPPATAPQREN